MDVLPPSEAEDYSVTVSRGCTDSNAGCWAGGASLGDMQFAGTGTATGSWPYRNSYTTGNKSGQITFAINGVTYTLSQLVRGCASPRQTALASTAYPLPAGKDVFLNFGPVSSDAGPCVPIACAVCGAGAVSGCGPRPGCVRASANRWLNRSPASLPLSLSMRSWNGLRTWSKVIRDAFVAARGRSGVRAGMAASFSHGAVRRSSSIARHRPRRARRSLPAIAGRRFRP